jgi:hypothetical protein
MLDPGAATVIPALPPEDEPESLGEEAVEPPVDDEPEPVDEDDVDPLPDGEPELLEVVEPPVDDEPEPVDEDDVDPLDGGEEGGGALADTFEPRHSTLADALSLSIVATTVAAPADWHATAPDD